MEEEDNYKPCILERLMEQEDVAGCLLRVNKVAIVIKETFAIDKGI